MSFFSKLFLCISVLFQCILFATDNDYSVLNKNGLLGYNSGYSAASLGKSRLALSFYGDFAYDPDMVAFVDTGSQRENNPFSVLYDFYPAFAYGITDNIDISILQPLYFDVIEGSLPSGGLGDLSASCKYRFVNNAFHYLSAAAMLSLTVPYNLKNDGYFLRNNYYIPDNQDSIESKWVLISPTSCYSSGKPDLTIVGIASAHWNRVEVHLNGGTLLNFNKDLDNILIGYAGAGFNPSEMFSLSGDIIFKPRYGAIAGPLSLKYEPLHTSLMTTIRTPTGVILSIGGSIRITPQKAHYFEVTDQKIIIGGRIEPLWNAFLQFSWSGGAIAKDRDNDQINDKYDACPDVAEDIDGFQDDDGCPDIDNDNDKIPDTHDTCANLPEDMDGFQDTDGCPDFDNDGDLIPDSLDACPGLPEDKDGFKDDDGCPDDDNDDDGVADSVDKCPTVAEDHDGFEDADGCPDYDNDMDAVPDSIDQCPGVAGSSMNDGCPEQKAKEIRFGRLILPGVHFDAGTTQISDDAKGELDRLYSSLVDWPEITIEIQSHTDNTLPQKKSYLVSKERAEAIRSYLTSKGIASSRIKATGKGSTSPIADNSAIEGRQLNDRVEIHRIK